MHLVYCFVNQNIIMLIKRGLPLKLDKPTAVPYNEPYGKTVEW